MWTLRVVAGKENGQLRLTLGGRLGAATTARLSAELADAIGGGERHILIDLKELDYISSSGLRAIEAASARLAGEGGELLLTGAQGAVRIALELAGLRCEVSDQC